MKIEKEIYNLNIIEFINKYYVNKILNFLFKKLKNKIIFYWHFINFYN